ncbi:uncharacterized protein RCC_02151 [Ramularia collo-cygni]|uniref:Uncharacterized protein n=1 Tax=Ramularia collo-cygni TaxID=112498 RepID=A0A2D3V480_9PEZI|nr:uncharacterized protein RCC_02151 [Ramularia collo-cygni]CZT16309.1 uncharacterized protein RCC_02151 [Ramularia collo-cygni]
MRYFLTAALLTPCASANLISEGFRSRTLNTTALQELPACATVCIDNVLLPASCQVDSSCFCESSSITTGFASCIEDGCRPEDWLVATRFQAETCGLPIRSRANISRGVNWAFLAIGTIFVGLRVVSRTRLLNGSGFRSDDFVVALSFAVTIALHVGLEFATKNGLGQDTYLLTTSRISEVLKWSYIGGILFQSVVILSKIAVVLLYLRIWTIDSMKKALRIQCWIVVAFLAATVLAFDLALIFQCWPIASVWNIFTGGPSSCVELQPLLYTFAGLNIFFNFVVFFLPIHSLRKLDIPWQKKAGVWSVFVMGVVVTVTSVVRLQYLVRLKDGNVTWDFQNVYMWSVIEASTSLICACMPSVTGIVQRCAGADSNGSSDDLIANSGSTTQKRLLRRGNNFYTVDRASADGAVAEISDEIFDLEKSHTIDHFQGMDVVPTGNQSRFMENLLGNDDHGDPRLDEAGIDETRIDDDIAGDNAPTTIDIGRPRHHQLKNQATDMAALLYRSKVSGFPKKVEISHDPPSEPAEARLTYRDEDNILHEVTVTDIPQPQTGPFHSGHGVRPTVLRAITEVESRTSKYVSGEFASPIYSPLYSPATPGSKLDDDAVTEAPRPQMVSASSQTDLFEPHALSPIRSDASLSSGGRDGGSIRPPPSSRSMSTQTDEQSSTSLASRTSSPAVNGLLTPPAVLSRTGSANTQDSEPVSPPPMASPGAVSMETQVGSPAPPPRDFRTATTQIDEADALLLTPKLIPDRLPSGKNVVKFPSPPSLSQHTSTQTLDLDLPFASPLSLASPLASPISAQSEASFVGLASMPSLNLTAGTQTDDNNLTPGSPLSSRRSSSTQTIGFLGLDSKRRLGI